MQFNPHKYSIDGFTFLVGRNNKENDYLTTKYAKKSDLWFHTKDIHGSHVILKTGEKDKPKLSKVKKENKYDTSEYIYMTNYIKRYFTSIPNQTR